MSIENLLKLRDAFQMASDAINKELEKHAPSETKELEWNPEAIEWVQAEGNKGPYKRYPNSNEKEKISTDNTNMIADLEVHNGKLMRDGYFYWQFSDKSAVGRKQRNK